MRFLDKVIDFIFPKEITVIELEKLSCEELLLKLPEARETIETKNNNTIALFAYRNKNTKTLISEIKYGRNKIILEKVGKVLADKIMENFEDLLVLQSQKIGLVPIPTSSGRESVRGYNQAEEIAKEIAINFPDSFIVLPILTKTKNTKRQALLRKEERLENLKNAFSLQSKIDITQVVIIDDIITTGATICEARRTLNDANINVIGGAVVAH